MPSHGQEERVGRLCVQPLFLSSQKRFALLIHRVEELFVGGSVAHSLLQKLHSLDGGEVGEMVAEDHRTGQNIGLDEEVVAAGGGGGKVDGGEDALVGEAAIELELHIAGALELLEDDVVHLGAGFGECGGDDGERTATLDIAGRTEEALGFLERIGLDATAKHLAGGRLDSIVGAGKTGDAVEHYHHVVATLGEAFGLLQHDIGDAHMTVGRLVEGGCYHLGLDGALHIGNLLGAFVDEQHHEVHLGVVVGNGVGYFLEQGRLTGLGLGYD